jgi:stage II sporulation protein D
MKRSEFLTSGSAFSLVSALSLTSTFAASLTLGAKAQRSPLEQYLCGIVAREMPASWPAAALQAQAISSRTYFLQRSVTARPYGSSSPNPNQPSPGTQIELPAATAAVDATAGKILRFGTSIASTVYSACCGGRTESSVNAWGVVDAPYLPSIVCPWCMPSPDYFWSRNVGTDVVTRTFSSDAATTAGPPDVAIATGPPAFGVLQNVNVGSTDSSGRARDFLLAGTIGSIHIPAPAFRQRLGTRVIRSLLIRRISSAPQDFTIEGAGYGHGVGLCQWGAKGMALAGHSTADILAFYFPGTTISDA